MVESTQLIAWDWQNTEKSNPFLSQYILVQYKSKFSYLSLPVTAKLIWLVENEKAWLEGYYIDLSDTHQSFLIDYI